MPLYPVCASGLNAKHTLAEQPIKVYSMPAQSDSDTKIAKKMAQNLRVPFVDPLRAAIEPSALSLLPPEMAIRRRALPIRVVDNYLLVGAAVFCEQYTKSENQDRTI